MEIKSYIRDIVDFPKKGIIFKDITPLLKDAEALKVTTEKLFDMVGSQKIDKVVGMESRGFIFAPLLAAKLNAGFIPVRKSGKLPHKTISASYSLEYGNDVLEMHIDGITKGEHVLVHDDVLATGGTAKAVCQMVEQLGGVVVQCNFLIELDFLNGKNKLKGYKVNSLLHY